MGDNNASVDIREIQKLMEAEMKKNSDDCPHCGRCKHCGRGGNSQYIPYYPTTWYPSPYNPWPTWTISSGSAGNVSDNVAWYSTK